MKEVSLPYFAKDNLKSFVILPDESVLEVMGGFVARYTKDQASMEYVLAEISVAREITSVEFEEQYQKNMLHILDGHTLLQQSLK